MNTTNTILIEEEPHLFDQAIVSLNPRWIEWQMAKHNVAVEQAIEQGNKKLVDVIDHFTHLISEDSPAPVNKLGDKQLAFMVENMHTYLRAFELFMSIQQHGWFERIKPSDPSIFATSGSAAPIQRWLHTVIKEHQLSTTHLTTLATFIINSIRSATRNQYEAKWGKKAPDTMTSSVPGIPNMLWVLHYALKKGCPLEVAHIEALTLLESEPKQIGQLNA